MKILVIASQKGGSGKSTLAAHLGVAAEEADAGPVVMLDSDPQGTVTEWWNARKSDVPALISALINELPEKLKALKDAGAKLVIIDTPPSATKAISDVVRLADFVLIPVRPSPNDLRAVGQSVDIVKEAGRPFAFCVTQAKATAKLTAQAIAALSAHGVVAPSIIADRVDFASSMIDGRTVLETDPRGRSAAEVKALFSFVQSAINEKKKSRINEKRK